MNKIPVQNEAMATEARFKTFEDLQVYRMAREFRKAMYGVTRRLPKLEQFELASQVRRAAVSVTNNIAEGHGRYHYLDQIKFCLQARGSLEELIDDLNICEDESYLPLPEVAGLKQQAWHLHKVLAGYMRWLRERKLAATLALHEAAPTDDLMRDELDQLLNVGGPGTDSTI